MPEKIWALVAVIAILVSGAVSFNCVQRDYELRKSCIEAKGIWQSYNGSCLIVGKA